MPCTGGTGVGYVQLHLKYEYIVMGVNDMSEAFRLFVSFKKIVMPKL